MIDVTVCDGKYRYIFNGKKAQALRHGEPWRDITGDGFILALAQDLQSAQEEREQFREQLTSMVELLKMADVESDTCCCGDLVQDHAAYSDHSPISEAEYRKQQLLNQAAKLLSGNT